MTTLAIIGTAGRGGLHNFMDVETFMKMVGEAVKDTRSMLPDRIHLVSGGAAWADHVAVNMFRSLPERFDLTICGPCPWDREKKRFHDTGVRNWKVNPGGTANYYHELFRQAARIDGLTQIDECHDFETGKFTYISGDGFHERNNLVVEFADYVLAFTFGHGDEPADGGTLHTWKLAKAAGITCRHVSIPALQGHPTKEVP